MTEPESPLARLVEGVKAALYLRKIELDERIKHIEQALESYRYAVEHQLAVQFAHDHSLKHPPARMGPTPTQAAEALRLAVLTLPELAGTTPLQLIAPPTSSEQPAIPNHQAAAQPSPAKGNTSSALRSAIRTGKLVILGGHSRTLALPPELNDQTEWLDTERHGTHAIGNLPQRIRQGRVIAVVILDRAVQHKHTEPVLAAARDAHIPIAFAGQGGKASLIRALAQVDKMLAERATKR